MKFYYQMKKRITLFLDLDGVLITTKPWQSDAIARDGYSDFQQNLTENFNKFLEFRDFEIILSSSRRRDVSLEKFNEIFQNRGINKKISAYIPVSLEKKTRKQEIEEYIHENLIRDFIILDDDKSLNGLEKKIKVKLVLTKYMLGFNIEKLDEATRKVRSIFT